MIDLQPLELSPAFRNTLDILERTDASVFITGKAGTGKSTLLQLFRNTTKKRVVVLAPTGIAALNVKGQTLHSFFGFPPKVIQASTIEKRRKRTRFEKVETIIIDEISMVRADMMDGIDRFLRINRENDSPFGGVQMIFFGDLFQLPPVVARREERHYFSTFYDTPYFFSAKVITSGFPLELIELTKVYRQEERRFIRLLDSIRTHSWDYDDIEELNARHIPHQEQNVGYITLCSVNAIANKINQARLNALDFDAKFYQAKITGEFPQQFYPTELHLPLKPGAQVVILRNDPEKRFVNGTIGQVKDLTDDAVFLRITNREGKQETVELTTHIWEMIKYEYDPVKKKLEDMVVGTFSQYPLKLAWAITIHKSQGKTFDNVLIDLGHGAFEYGQTYVALSRCRTLDGIVLKRALKPSDIMVDERIIEFYEVQRRYLPGGF